MVSEKRAESRGFSQSSLHGAATVEWEELEIEEEFKKKVLNKLKPNLIQ